MNTSVTHRTPAAHVIGEVPGTERLLGRSQADLTDAMTWLAWYAPGTYTAVMDYMDHCDNSPVAVGGPVGV